MQRFNGQFNANGRKVKVIAIQKEVIGENQSAPYNKQGRMDHVAIVFIDILLLLHDKYIT